MKKLSLICLSLIVLLSSCAVTSNEVSVGFYSKIKDRAPSHSQGRRCEHCHGGHWVHPPVVGLPERQPGDRPPAG